MTDNRIVITGIGVVSPIGNGKEEFWQALIQGRNGIEEIVNIDTSSFRTHRGGEVKKLEPRRFFQNGHSHPMGRGSQFAIAATRMALEDAELLPADVDCGRIGVCGGTTMGECQVLETFDSALVRDGQEGISPDLTLQYSPDMIPANVAREFGFGGPLNMFTTACAAGNFAIGYACDLLQAGSAKMMIAGGADPFSRVAFTGFNSMLAVAPDRCQPFDRNRKGMVVSEGCAMLLLEVRGDAIARGAHIYAEVASYAVSNDAYHMTSPHPQARGAISAMTQALREAALVPEQVDYISAHGTGTPANDKIETAAIKTVFGKEAYRIPISSIKSMLGHTMGAASAIEAAACALVIDRNLIPPTINYECPDPECDLDYVPNVARPCSVNIALSNAFAFGGNCSALMLKRCEA